MIAVLLETTDVQKVLLVRDSYCVRNLIVSIPYIGRMCS